MNEMLAPVADTLRTLVGRLPALAGHARSVLGPIPELEGEEWYGVLVNKLVPQLVDEPCLIAAIVGGTNIGKTTIFNHLAGAAVNEASAQAAYTKHPVCLVPEHFFDRHTLAPLFPSFVVTERTSPAESMKESAEDRLFWERCPSLPDNLILLDTPDINSVAVDNPRRATMIRQAADVLIAVLTQQNHNDAVVKQFFREAGLEQKAVIVVFSQVELPDDEVEWPGWLEKFLDQTDIAPLAVCLVPRDRAKAKQLQLEFLMREVSGQRVAKTATVEGVAPLKRLLTDLKFAELKLQAARGALGRVCDPDRGLAWWLQLLKQRSRGLADAQRQLSERLTIKGLEWPSPPSHILVKALREEWARHRTGFEKHVHATYNTIGQTLLTPITWARDWMSSAPQVSPLEVYMQAERTVIIESIENIYERLEWLAEHGNPLLVERIRTVIGGASRSAVVSHLQAAHAESHLEAEITDLVSRELSTFRAENPQWSQTMKRIDQAAAVARPALSVVLLVTGVGLPAGEIAAQAAGQAIVHSSLHLAGDLTAGVAVGTMGEAVASRGVGDLFTRFQRLYHGLEEKFVQRRIAWLDQVLQPTPLGELLQELKAGGDFQQDPLLREVGQLLTRLQTLTAGLAEGARG